MGKKLSQYEIGMEEVNESIYALREKILKEEKEKRKALFEKNLKDLNKISLCNLANNNSGEESYKRYEPYLIPFEELLERIKGKNELDSSDEDKKVRLDLAEQLSKMKKYPPLDTLCHIESYKKYSEFRHWVARCIFKKRKYKIIFHDKNVKFEDIYYVKETSKTKAWIIFLTVIFFIMLFICNFFCSFKLTFKVILTFLAIILMLYIWD